MDDYLDELLEHNARVQEPLSDEPAEVAPDDGIDM